MQVTHLLGATRGRLIVTSITPYPCIRALDLATGRPIREWMQPADGTGGLRTMGRGFLAGDYVYWPTEHGLHVLRIEDGAPVAFSEKIQGNLATARGCLVVTTQDRLMAYLPERLLLKHRQREFNEHPTQRSRYQLALAEADAGLHSLALANLAGVEAQSSGLLRERARHKRHHVLLEAAAHAERVHDTEQAAAYFALATEANFAPEEQCQALVRAAEFWARAGKHEQATAIWQKLRDDPILSAVALNDSERLPQAVRLLALERLGGTTAAATPLAKSAATPVELSWPLQRVWSWSGPESTQLFPLTSGELLAGDGRTLTCLDPETPKPRWSIPWPRMPTWTTAAGDLHLVAQTNHLAALGRADGRVLWQWSAAGVLDGFHIAGGRLFVRQDQCRLLAFDVLQGRVLWNAWAPNALLHLPLPAGSFLPDFVANEYTVSLQTTSGQRWTLAADTGLRLQATPIRQEPWPPFEVLTSQAIAHVSDRARIDVLEASTGSLLWTYHLAGPASSSGVRPSVRAGGQSLLVLNERSHGAYLDHRDVIGGSRRWPAPVYLGIDAVDLQQGALDEHAAYFAHGPFVEARSLADGKRLWRAPLPLDGWRWQLLRSGRLLLGWPHARAATLWTIHVPGGTAQVELPRMEEIHQGVPLLVWDAESGDLMQRMNLPTSRPALHFDWQRHRKWMTYLDWGTHWQALSDLAVQHGPKGICVRIGPQAWNLRPFRRTGL